MARTTDAAGARGGAMSRLAASAGGDRGSITAEFAAVVPAVILVLTCCLGAVSVVGQQVRLTDAAADGARSLARGDGLGVATARVRHAVDGADVHSSGRGDFVCLRVSAPAAFGPAGALGLTLSATSCALAGGR